MPIIIGLCGLGIAFAVDRQYLIEKTFVPIISFIPSFFIAIFLGGIEEFGWRGVFQPELSKRLNLFLVNLLIGIVWAFWHLPLFYIAGSSHEGGSFFFFALSAIGYSSFLTYLYAKTKSVLLCVIFHASINATASTALSVSMHEASVYPYYSLFVFVIGLLFIMVMGKNLKKEN